MIQLRTQKESYWGPGFTLTNQDIEQISAHFLETERPKTASQLAHVVITYRVAEEKNNLQQLLSGRKVYNPREQYQAGDDLVFPMLQFLHGTVGNVRQGYNPEYGKFPVITVDIKGKPREFASGLTLPQMASINESAQTLDDLVHVDLNALYRKYTNFVAKKVTQVLEKQAEFVRLGPEWFMKALMADINVGHLHLAEAILEMSQGGPLPADEILPHLDMDPSIPVEVQRFSLNLAMLQDKRFDEVAPVGQISWFLRRMEPEEVKKIPPILQYRPVSYDQALLSPQLIVLEQELDDEWSSVKVNKPITSVNLTLTYPHRVAGTIPFNSHIQALLPPSNSPRQRIVFIDEFTNEQVVGWVIRNGRYIHGLSDWYQSNGIPIGGFIYLKHGPEPGIILLSYDRRRAQREWMRLATVANNRIQFELSRRSIGCGYDDLMIVGTDVLAAVEVLHRRAEANQRSVASLLAEIFPELGDLAPQGTVHAKTLYSTINMLRRLPPGPIFAELVRHPAFQPVGDHYWRFDSSRWHRDVTD